MKHLFVRAGVSAISISVADTVGVSEGNGGPGYLVGAGYDLFVSRRLAITPLVNYFGGNINNVTYQAGAGTTSTQASLTALNAGIALTYSRVPAHLTVRAPCGLFRRGQT